MMKSEIGYKKKTKENNQNERERIEYAANFFSTAFFLRANSIFA